MKTSKPIVWVIMHYEYMGRATSPWIDSVQLHVASSLKKAETYIRSIEVEAYSWWQVHPHVLDAPRADWLSEGAEVSFYSHRGTRLKSAPFTRALNAFKKHTARDPEQDS